MTPHLSFDGRCEEAFRHYAKVLGATLAYSLTWDQAPKPTEIPAGWGKKIMHATLNWNGFELGGGDAPPGWYKKPQGFSVALEFDDPREAERVFAGLSDGGAVTMPLQETFWARRFGMAVDRFGVPWMVNCGKPR